MTIEIDFNPPVEATSVDDIEAYRAEPKQGVDPKEVFPQSVASGGPTSEGVIGWTRINPNAYREDISLIVEIAEDEDFTENHQRRVVDSETITPTHDYTVKVDLDESNLSLEDDHRYYFQFEYNGVTSQTGRFRTLPDENTSPENIRFAVVSCQDYQNGYYGAFHHVAKENVDFLVHLGDSIYEVIDGRFALHPETYDEHDVGMLQSEKGSETGVVHELKDYRHLYRTYHSNRFFQEALERHTRIDTWDDHEFANDIHWEYGSRAPKATPRAPKHPLDGNPERMRRLVGDALKAWDEYTPARVEYNRNTEEINESLKLYQKYQFGDLVTLLMTDERLFRTKPQPRQVKTRLRNWIKNRLSLSANSNDTDKTMLGKKQRKWFISELHGSKTNWTVWGNEVLTLPLRVHLPFYNHEAWDGYEEEREELMREVLASLHMVSRHGESHRGVRNFITLTGDMHSYLAGYQRTGYPEDTRIGVELMTPSITSINISEAIPKVLRQKKGRISDITEFLVSTIGDPTVSKMISRTSKKGIRNVEFFGSHEHGYSIATFTPDHCTYQAYSVDKTENSADAERKLAIEVRIPNGQIEIQKLT